MDSLARGAKSDKAAHMRFLALSTILLALGACQSNSGIGNAFDTRQNSGTCPPAGAIYSASRVVVFDGENQLFPNVEYTGEIVDVAGTPMDFRDGRAVHARTDMFDNNFCLSD